MNKGGERGTIVGKTHIMGASTGPDPACGLTQSLVERGVPLRHSFWNEGENIGEGGREKD